MAQREGEGTFLKWNYFHVSKLDDKNQGKKRKSKQVFNILLPLLMKEKCNAEYDR